MFPLENTCTNLHLLPRGLAWGKEYRRTKERTGEVMTFRRWLDNLTGVTWYLGDQVTQQSLGFPEFVVPGPLPPRVQRTATYTRAELEQFTVPDTDLEKHLRRTLDYAAYRDRYLAMSLRVERELERRVAEAEARGGAIGTGGEAGAPRHGGRSLICIQDCIILVLKTSKLWRFVS
ncbi:hypothetical protein RHMOL_Rhmol02G0166000 [Rhododendron molle]|uniref:Uncharacterized protein n=1 Tax=Rhododendron molle TaxID=49168 RepID=A0ACC0PTA7_RHOML|nr:hypothetical protein RHMOL_Rhmol02G0166000 [Rhododendron molle]